MNIRANEALSRIKVSVETPDMPSQGERAGRPVSDGKGLLRRRSAVRIGSLLMAVLIPLSGLFRIDPAAGAFVVLDWQIWFSDAFIVGGFWIALSSALIMTYSTLGMAFCGWVCPQNTFSEWANRMTQRYLGKRAHVSLEGHRLQVSPGKRKWTNWAVLGGLFLGASMFLALIPLLYFYPPGAIWSFLTLQEDSRLAGSLHWIYTVFVLVILVDLTVIRHFFCRFMCIYRVWQHSFKTRGTLRIAHDSSRGERCKTCSYCVKACPVGIDPRNTTTFDSCINCGACISACDALHYNKGEPGLLSFELGERRGSKWERGLRRVTRWKANLSSLGGRISWTLPLTLLGLMLFSWGVYHYDPYHLTVFRANFQGAEVQDYRIGLANKQYDEAVVEVEVQGLPAGSYQLEQAQMGFETAGRKDLHLHIKDELPEGLHRVIVQAKSRDGWRASKRVHHFVAGGQ